MNKKFLLTVVAGSFILAMILVGCGADATTGTSTAGIVKEPTAVPTSSASEGGYCYSAEYDECISMEEEGVTATECTAAGGSVVDSCN